MKTKLFLLVAFLGGALLLTQSLRAADEDGEAKFDCKCPVSGKAALESSSLDHQGKKVYFCCTNCPKAFAKDPEKFQTKVHHQWAATGQIVQVACPFSGRPLNAETAIDVAGVSVAFCCNNCKAKAEKSDDALALVFAKIDQGYTLQDKCPVSGRPIKADKVVEHDGQKVYFCCPNCSAAFEKDPEKFLAKLPQFEKSEQ